MGIVFAWLPIWMGILLHQSAAAIERAQVTGDKAALTQSLSKIKTYFTISGVTAIIGLVAAIAAMIVGGLGALFGLLSEFS